MQSKVNVDKINRMRDFVSDMAGDAELSSLHCHLREDYLRYGMSTVTESDDDFCGSITLVPKDVREDYALRFIEWTFDDTVVDAEFSIDYGEVAVTVQFIGGEGQRFSQRFYPDEDDDDETIAIHAIKVRRK